MPCSITVGPNAGTINRGQVYALGTGEQQISITVCPDIAAEGSYTAGGTGCTFIESYTGQWAWHERSFNITTVGPGSGGGNNTTAQIPGWAIKVSD
jgi:hypothetical protein